MFDLVCRFTGHWWRRSRWMATRTGWRRVSVCRCCGLTRAEDLRGSFRPFD